MSGRGYLIPFLSYYSLFLGAKEQALSSVVIKQKSLQIARSEFSLAMYHGRILSLSCTRTFSSYSLHTCAVDAIVLSLLLPSIDKICIKYITTTPTLPKGPR